MNIKHNMYIIRVFNKSSSLVKIGYSATIVRKLKTYYYHNPLIELVGTFKADAVYEKQFHNDNAATALNEWYNEAILDVLSNEEIDYYNLPLIEVLNGMLKKKGGVKGRTRNKVTNYDHTLYTFYHSDGKVEKDITKFNLSKKYSLGKLNFKELIEGRYAHIKGWYLDPENEIYKLKTTKFNWAKKGCANELGKTIPEMSRLYNILEKTLYRVVRSGSKSSKNWYIIK